MLYQKDFEHLYKSFYSDLIRISYNVVYDYEAAEDICQEAFIKLYNRLDIFPSQQDAKYWLIRVTRNLSLNHFKRKKNERNAVNKIKKVPLKRMKTGEQVLIESETMVSVQQALEQLPEKFRSIIILKEYSNMNYRDIGKTLGISEGNVKVRAFRARKKLEDILSMEGDYVS